VRAVTHDYAAVLGVLAAILIATKILGALAQRFGQPAVLGELVAGILLGKSLLGILDPSDPLIGVLSEIGVVILLFAIGLETDLRKLMRVGGSAFAVGVTGVILPFLLGYFTALQLGVSNVTAIVCGAALTATSVGISARVLSDLGRLNTDEGQIVLGAAVIDDVIGLVILSIVSSVVAGTAITMGSVTYTVAIAVGFLAATIVLGSLLVPPIFKYLDGTRLRDSAGAIAIALGLLAAWLAGRAGSAAIIGAFAAGLILHGTVQRDRIERVTTALGHFFVPVFFAVVGAAVDISVFGDTSTVKIAAALFLVGVAGKYAAGFAPFWFRGSKSLIGISMIPRGEVGLIFAQMGIASGALDSRLFSAITIVVMGTTFLVPPLLATFNNRTTRSIEENPRGSGGVDDLVA
jgi:Kef-type K+ transport system membrane component KefB